MIHHQNYPKRLPPNSNLNPVLSPDGTQGFLLSQAFKTSIVAIKRWTEVWPREVLHVWPFPGAPLLKEKER